jgi:Outer membrane lipoprotein-sorting protein
MRFISTLMITLILGAFAYSQDDAKSKEILAKVTSTNNSYKTIKVEYKLTTSSMQNGEMHTENGLLLMKGDKYHLTLTNSDITFDGKSIYTYLKEANEINITKPEPSKVDKGDFFFSNPRDIFKGYNKNFKSTFIKETNVNGTICYELDLYPIDLKTKYLRIRMHIKKSTYQIADVKLFFKDGTQYFIEFSNFVVNSELSDKEFVFDEKKYPKAEVNDMRF